MAIRFDETDAFFEDAEREAIANDGYPAPSGETLREGAVGDNDDAAPKPAPRSPLDVITSWRAEGPLVRVPTGIGPLDDLCRGGLPIPWRTFIIGAPSAGKTFVAACIADTMARRLASAGLCVGILGVDEDPDDLTVRLAQMAGFTVAEAEARDPDVLDAMAAKLGSLNVHLYDAAFTIEAAGVDLAQRAKAQGRRGAFFVDSIHAAKSAAAAALETDSARQVIEANVGAFRYLSSVHRLLVTATGEANRASYRTEAAADEVNDMASGAESRAIEFCGQTMLMLRTPKGHRDVVHVRVPKNRRADDGEFWLRLDRERHTVTPCPNPADEPGVAEEQGQKKKAANKRTLERDAVGVLRIVRSSPGIGTRGLRAAIKLAGLRVGHASLDALLLLLERSERIENRPTARGDREDPHYFATHAAGVDE